MYSSLGLPAATVKSLVHLLEQVIEQKKKRGKNRKERVRKVEIE
jgi:hypothetical protein